MLSVGGLNRGENDVGQQNKLVVRQSIDDSVASEVACSTYRA